MGLDLPYLGEYFVFQFLLKTLSVVLKDQSLWLNVEKPSIDLVLQGLQKVLLGLLNVQFHSLNPRDPARVQLLRIGHKLWLLLRVLGKQLFIIIKSHSVQIIIKYLWLNLPYLILSVAQLTQNILHLLLLLIFVAIYRHLLRLVGVKGVLLLGRKLRVFFRNVEEIIVARSVVNVAVFTGETDPVATVSIVKLDVLVRLSVALGGVHSLCKVFF